MDHPVFLSKNGKIRAILKEKNFMDSKLLIKDGDKTLVKLYVTKPNDPPFPNAVYWIDVDGNGLKDFIVLSSHRGTGIGLNFDYVDIYLKKPDRSYQRISFETWAVNLKDFVDLNRNGKYEVIITGFDQGQSHNYYSYNIYAFYKYRLINADQKFPGFPKYVRLTKKPNDKDSHQLSKEERLEFALKKERSIFQETYQLPEKRDL
ncbi:MAG: hypothetical protein WCG06_02490 [Candidatus Omnitrophota bacterium]